MAKRERERADNIMELNMCVNVEVRFHIVVCITYLQCQFYQYYYYYH